MYPVGPVGVERIVWQQRQPNEGQATGIQVVVEGVELVTHIGHVLQRMVIHDHVERSADVRQGVCEQCEFRRLHVVGEVWIHAREVAESKTVQHTQQLASSASDVSDAHLPGAKVRSQRRQRIDTSLAPEHRYAQ